MLNQVTVSMPQKIFSILASVGKKSFCNQHQATDAVYLTQTFLFCECVVWLISEVSWLRRS